MLRHVRTVIVDEVHTLARDKRGSHLALSLERLARLVEASGGHLQRIGLSATQKPLEVVARLLCGVGADRPMPEIVDCGHRRGLDVAIELPDAELEAVAPNGQFGEILDRIADLVRQHQTTLVFVNTRKLAERVAHQLAERLDTGPGSDGDSFVVAAHHGSLSTERRRIVEARLRAGSLRALVATASLELGIDVGPVALDRHVPPARGEGQPPAGGHPLGAFVPPDP
jgi:ATP-dependent Lhr-like helicase